ncbi:MAG TPA: hypothetical protein VIT45_07915 [Allosphingosinicella sp.]
MRFFLAPIVAALLWAPVVALAKEAPATPAAADEAAKLAAIGERGRLLFDLDRAAWVATDALMAKVPGFAQSRLNGYIVERENDGFVVTFYGGEGDTLTAAHIVHVAGGRVTSSETIEPASRMALTPLQLRLAKARSVRPGKDVRPCTRAAFNVAIVPPTGQDSPMEIYLTSPQVEKDVYPFGGHYRLILAADGSIASTRKFTNACLDMPRPPGAGGEEGVLFVTHLLDPVPTEIHVFMSLQIGLPVVVSTSEPFRLWVVNGESISGTGFEAPAPRRKRRRD